MSLEPTVNIWGGIEVFVIWVLKNPFGHHILDLTIYRYILIYFYIFKRGSSGHMWDL